MERIHLIWVWAGHTKLIFLNAIPNSAKPQTFSAAFLFLLLALSLSFRAHGNVTEWMSMDEFLAEAFPEQNQTAEVLWITPELREKLEATLDRKFPGLRVRFWASGDQTAWTLEQIGKERPITAGFVVQGGKLIATHVLVYRESRGGEIRYQSFRDQFVDAQLDNEKPELNKHIDGITGATLSVRSMRQMAAAALILHAAANAGNTLAVD